MQIHIATDLFLQTRNIPLFFQALRRNKVTDQIVNHLFTNRIDGFGDITGCHQIIALVVDRPALIVGDIIVFQQLFADIEVAPLNFTLGFFDRVRDHLVLDRLALLHPQLLHKAAHPLGREDPH